MGTALPYGGRRITFDSTQIVPFFAEETRADDYYFVGPLALKRAPQAKGTMIDWCEDE
jgi:hypothetical protein